MDGLGCVCAQGNTCRRRWHPDRAALAFPRPDALWKPPQCVSEEFVFKWERLLFFRHPSLLSAPGL
eukprot:11834725-Prorocentrum_lima.AAC.1